MTRTILPTIIAMLFIATAATTSGDELLYRYEADALPVDAGWQVFDPCVPPCSEQIVDGQLVLEWPANFSDVVNYNRVVSDPPEPPPASFWVEWRFKSIRERPNNRFGCDGRVTVIYFEQPESLLMHGDGAETPSGSGFIFGLSLDTFRTFRFESVDAEQFSFFIDGMFLAGGSHSFLDTQPNIQFSGEGGCWPSLLERNTWDYVRYGTISFGEQIISSDPPSGLLSSLDYPLLDRFTVTFDAPNFVNIPNITVTTTGGPVPAVLQTRRNDGFGVDTLEIVLDHPLTVGETTTFTFDDGVAVNVVSYTLERAGACCGPTGACSDALESECSQQGGVFAPGLTCNQPAPCCTTNGLCESLDPICCEAMGGVVQGEPECEGDQDGDGTDGLCGDVCPNDPDNDIDGDGLCADVDDCPDLNPNDADNDGTPDCFEEPVIPTVSTWGLVVLTLACLIGGALMSRRRRDVI